MENQFAVPANPLLKDTVQLFWETKGYPGYLDETIIPGGMVEMIFNLSADPVFHAEIGTNPINLPRCFVNGFNTVPVVLHVPVHHDFFGIRFHPAALRRVLGVPAGELANQVIDLTLINHAVKILWEQLAEAIDFRQRVQLFSHWIHHRLGPPDAKETALNEFLNHHQHTSFTVTMLAKKLYFSTRQLSRRFHAVTGMSTEEILLYKKYLQAVTLIHFTGVSLTEIAYTCHFTDQSHFIKTFKSFTTITPGEYRKQKSALPGHLFT